MTDAATVEKKELTLKTAVTDIINTDEKNQEENVETFKILQAVSGAQNSKIAAAEDILLHTDPIPANTAAIIKTLDAILSGASPDDAAALKVALNRWRTEPLLEKALPNKDDELVDNWRTATYPYKNRMLRKNYEKQKYHLQVELLKLQAWVRETGQRIVIVFEGRDAAARLSVLWSILIHAVLVWLPWKNPPKPNKANGIFNVM